MHQQKANAMADPCTYADLRFVKTKKKQQNPGSHPTASRTASSEDGELTYENIKSSGVSAERPNSGSAERGSQEKEVQQPRTKHIVYILLMICLILLATCIGLGVRFAQVSTELQQVSEKHEQQSSLLFQTNKMSDKAQQEFDQTKKDLTHLQQTMSSYNYSLLLSNREVEQCNMKLNGTLSKLIQTEAERKQCQGTENEMKLYFAVCENTDCCPKGWKLLGGSCFLFSEIRTIWSDSRRDCESRGAQLLVRRNHDSTIQTLPPEPETILQAFLKTKYYNEQFWIGLTKNTQSYWKWNWIDNQSYTGSLGGYGACGFIKHGNLLTDFCSAYKYWICEKVSLRIVVKDIFPDEA